MIKATNTCSVGTLLQMLYCMWAWNVIPHQIIEDCDPILSKSLSLVNEESHTYDRVLFINDATERKEDISDEIVKKEIVGNK